MVTAWEAVTALTQLANHFSRYQHNKHAENKSLAPQSCGAAAHYSPQPHKEAYSVLLVMYNTCSGISEQGTCLTVYNVL